MSIIASMEALTATTPVLDNDQAFEQLYSEAMEAELDIIDAQTELDEANFIIESNEATIEKLELAIALIEEDGMCRSNMRAIDPKEELRTLGCVSCSYQDLPVNPIKDAEANSAIESIKNTIKKIWKAICDFFKGIWAKLKGLFDRIFKGYGKQEKVIVALIEKYGKIDGFDATKLKDAKVKSYKVEDKVFVGKAVGTGLSASGAIGTDQLIALAKKGVSSAKLADIEGAVDKGYEKLVADKESIAKAFGAKVKVETKDGIKSYTWESVPKEMATPTEMDFTAVHKTPDDVVVGLKKSYEILGNMKKNQVNFDKVVALNQTAGVSIEKEIKVVDGLEGDALKDANKVVKAYRDAVKLTTKINSYLASTSQRTVGVTIKVAKKGLGLADKK